MTNTFTLPIDSLIIPAEIVDAILAEGQLQAPIIDSITSMEPPPANKVFNDTYIATDRPIPNAFIVGLSYTSSRGAGSQLSAKDLENIPVGIQEHAIEPGSMAIVAGGEAPIPDNLNDVPYSEDVYKANEKEAYEIARKMQKQPAKKLAFEAQIKRVSRRALLAERAKNLTVICPETGIVSQLDVPAVPGMVLTWTSPFSDIGKCRSIAQRGKDYLWKLDTQVLAGVLITLSSTYELFRFQPFDSGAQKNAILRTVGKDYLIKAIIMIEQQIHSGNAKYLPQLSLILDSVLEAYGAEVKMQAWLKLVAEAIAKPDTSVYDSNYVNKEHRIRPLYKKDVEKAKQTISFLAKKEVAAAKKQYADDRKAGKIAITSLCSIETVSDKLKGMLMSLMAEDALLLVPSGQIEKIVARLERYLSIESGEIVAPAKTLIGILTKDRRLLTMDLEEIEESIADREDTKEEQDEPAPGNEEAVEESAEGNLLEALALVDDSASIDSEDSNEEDFQDSEGDAYVADMLEEEEEQEQKEEPKQEELQAPAGLNAVEKILWKKKMQAALNPPKKRNFVQNTDIPSVAVYVPSADKEKLGKD